MMWGGKLLDMVRMKLEILMSCHLSVIDETISNWINLTLQQKSIKTFKVPASASMTLSFSQNHNFRQFQWKLSHLIELAALQQSKMLNVHHMNEARHWRLQGSNNISCVSGPAVANNWGPTRSASCNQPPLDPGPPPLFSILSGNQKPHWCESAVNLEI